MLNAASFSTKDRNISGFDVNSNQTILWYGVEFKFPSYFDVRGDDSDETLTHYYPRPDNMYATLLFRAYDFTESQESFHVLMPDLATSIVNDEFSGRMDISESKTSTIAQLPGWMISFYERQVSHNDVTTQGNHAFILNSSLDKLIIVSILFDSIDQSLYDYLGDFQKTINSAELKSEETYKDLLSATITYGSPVNIRERAEASSPRIGIAQPNESFQLLEIAENGWLKIRFSNVQTGWISGKMASIGESTITNLQPKDGNNMKTIDQTAIPLDLNAINNTNTSDADARFIDKFYEVSGVVDQAMGPSDGYNALVIIQPDVMARGMNSMLPLEINIWMTPNEYEKIGGSSSAGKKINLIVKLTGIHRNATSNDRSIKGYPIQLEFGDEE